MPRGGLRIVQSSVDDNGWLKDYFREYHTQDAITWKAMLAPTAVCGEDCWAGGMGPTSYFREFLLPRKIVRVIAAPLQAPVFEGFSGAIHVMRSTEMGTFQDAEVAKLLEVARDLDLKIAQFRGSRLQAKGAASNQWSQRPAVRQFVFNSSLRTVIAPAPGDIDEHLREEVCNHAKWRMDQGAALSQPTDRVEFAAADGRLFGFRVTFFPRYSALGDGPAIFYCMEPGVTDWQTLEPSDVRADSDMARLVPTIQFMCQSYQRGPVLGEIASSVQLSPFHFHRRFTELLGLTPKRLLLECQISQAQQLLANRQTNLAEISAACGFAHQSHFTSRFKQATGLTPTRWRHVVCKPIEQPVAVTL